MVFFFSKNIIMFRIPVERQDLVIDCEVIDDQIKVNDEIDLINEERIKFDKSKLKLAKFKNEVFFLCCELGKSRNTLTFS